MTGLHTVFISEKISATKTWTPIVYLSFVLLSKNEYAFYQLTTWIIAQLLSSKTTIIPCPEWKCFMSSLWSLRILKTCVFKGPDLIKWAIFTISSRSFWSDMGLFLKFFFLLVLCDEECDDHQHCLESRVAEYDTKNMSFGHKDDFELKTLGKQQVLE